MKSSWLQLYKNFDHSVDKVKQLSEEFCESLGITTFGYVRVYNDGNINWVTSNPDQDRFLVESNALNTHPLVDTKTALQEGCYLDCNTFQFPGCETFYRVRAKRFQMDHGMSLVRHQKEYLEIGCFSGLITKRPLFQIFMNEQALFRTFFEYFTTHLDRRLVNILKQSIPLGDLKVHYGLPDDSMCISVDRQFLIESCGWKNLLTLSKREKECLALLKEGHAYQDIGLRLGLSVRTVEHYLESVRNKLGVESRSELYLAAEKLIGLRLL